MVVANTEWALQATISELNEWNVLEHLAVLCYPTG